MSGTGLTVTLLAAAALVWAINGKRWAERRRLRRELLAEADAITRRGQQ